ncbi:hypothetical protein NH26_23535 [Flammeovirga pacifica]|uniref:Outer membrane protein TolC n=2 Tax=Flammeovirga pacifica TaxID=915059 RepID=A0A1S1YU57_FLAPC|nr:hypothetical protein NH26_23535 [Flammeovirga pacifica]
MDLHAQNQLSIGIMADMKSLKTDSLDATLKGEIQSLLGHKYDLKYSKVLYNEHNIKKAKSQYDELVASNYDVIISFGATNALMFHDYNMEFTVPTILAGFINQDFIDLPSNSKTSGINNFTYLITPFSITDDIVSFNSLVESKKLGIVVDHFLLENFQIEEVVNKLGINYKMISIDNASDTLDFLNDIDAIYFNSTEQLDSLHYAQVIEKVNSLKLPSFSAYGISDLEMGVMATNQPKVNFPQIFRRIALSIESITRGENLADLPVKVNYKKELTVNLEVAEYIGITFNNSEIVNINFVQNTVKLEEQPYTLKSVMNIMVHNNLTLDTKRRDIAIKDQDVRLSKSNYLPELGVNAGGTYVNAEMAELSFGQNPEYSMAGNVQLKQTIYSADASTNIKISKLALEAEKEEFNAFELDQLFEVSLAYYNTLIYETNKSIQLQNLQLTKENLRLAEENLELGVGGKSDVLRFQSQLTQNVQSLIEAKNTVGQSHLALNKLLNLPMEERIALDDSLLLSKVGIDSDYEGLLELLDQPRDRLLLTKFLISESLTNSPELQSLNYNKESLLKNYKLNQNGRFLPTVALQGQYNQFFLREGAGVSMPTGFPSVPLNNYNVGLNVSIPIFQQNTRNINKQKSKIQMDQLSVQKQDYEQNIEKFIHEGIIGLINEITNIEISRANMSIADKNLTLSQSEYTNGIIPVVQLIDAQNNYLEAKMSFSTAQYNYFIVSMQIQRAMGYFFLMNSKENNQDFLSRAEQYIRNN